MRKIISLLLVGMMILSLAACGATNSDSTPDSAGTNNSVSADNASDPEEITVTCLNGDSETVDITVPYSPERVAVVDFASLDILDNLGLGDRVVGCVNVTLDYISSYMMIKMC